MTQGTLSQRLTQALEQSKLDVDILADRTKIPRATIRSLLGENVSAVLPERVYLRGQLGLIARELGVPQGEARALFDAENPIAEVRSIDLDTPRISPGTTVLAASLGCIALLAIVLAFVS
jgi:cytoskeletal protein RodZ